MVSARTNNGQILIILLRVALQEILREPWDKNVSTRYKEGLAGAVKGTEGQVEMGSFRMTY